MSKDIKFRYEEDRTIFEAIEYIKSTYGEHYTTEEDEPQLLDLFSANDDAEAYCRTSIMRYAYRFGKKGGRNLKDLMKIIHLAILWYHFAKKKA